MIAWSGYDVGISAYVLSGSVYNPANNTWTAMPLANAPEARNDARVQWTGSKLIVWGGRRPFPNPAALNSGGVYDPTANTWTTMNTVNAPSPRGRESVAWTGSRLLVWGGLSETSDLANGALYDPVANSWSVMSSANAPSARFDATATVMGGIVVVYGGASNSGQPVQPGGIYNPSNNIWIAISNSNAPAPRFQDPMNPTTVISAGNKLIVWGGMLASTPSSTNTGAVLDPTTNVWSTMNTSDAPEARKAPSALWTGSYFVVWGGESDGPTTGGVRSGGLFNPATNLWAPITVTDEPTMREDAIVKWIDGNLVVWGGRDLVSTGAFLNTGNIYQAGSNRWIRMATLNAPEPRDFASGLPVSALVAVDKLIIWGGVSAQTSQLLNTGAVYDPKANAWTTISTNGAPPARVDALVEWVGGKFVVWGGRNDGVFPPLNTGFAYDIATNTWVSMSTFNAPSARTGSNAFHHNGKLVVWGGWDAAVSQPVNTGSVYDPDTNTWSAMSSLNAPSPREGHVNGIFREPLSAFSLAGGKLLIWGGRDPMNYDPLNSGGIYDFTTGTWTPVSMSNAPAATIGALVRWTGTRMVVWGGGLIGSSAMSNAGGVFDPVANTWTTMSTVNAPSGRDAAHSIVMNNRLVIWGGGTFLGGQSLNTGGIFNVLTNTWVATSLSGAPMARAQYRSDQFSENLAMFPISNDRVLVWGGLDDSNLSVYPYPPVNTGGILNVVNNTWTPMSNTNAPVWTRSHWEEPKRFWTGSQFIVWGKEYGVTGGGAAYARVYSP
jgi:N-acetylneuraminic acid mutarotase